MLTFYMVFISIFNDEKEPINGCISIYVINTGILLKKIKLITKWPNQLVLFNNKSKKQGHEIERLIETKERKK